jgi:hypothetical protein
LSISAARAVTRSRQVARGRLVAHLAQDLEPLWRKHEIEHQRVGARREQALEALVAVRDRGHLGPRARVVAHEIADLLLVLDPHHETGHHPSARAC